MRARTVLLLTSCAALLAPACGGGNGGGPTSSGGAGPCAPLWQGVWDIHYVCQSPQLGNFSGDFTLQIGAGGATVEQIAPVSIVHQGIVQNAPDEISYIEDVPGSYHEEVTLTYDCATDTIAKKSTWTETVGAVTNTGSCTGVGTRRP